MNTTSPDSLKACPSGHAVDPEECPYPCNRIGTIFAIGCTNTDCAWWVHAPTPEQAIAAWNALSTPPVSQQGIEPVAFVAKHAARGRDYFGPIADKQTYEGNGWTAEPLYPQSAIDSLRAEIERLKAERDAGQWYPMQSLGKALREG